MIYQLYNEEEARKQGFTSLESKEAARDYVVNGIMKQFDDYGYGVYKIIRKTDDVVVGTCGLIKRNNVVLTSNEVNIGFILFTRYTRQGYAFEAVSEMIKHAITDLHIDPLVASASKTNLASIALIEKLGFKYSHDIEIPKYAPDIDAFFVNQSYDYNSTQPVTYDDTPTYNYNSVQPVTYDDTPTYDYNAVQPVTYDEPTTVDYNAVQPVTYNHHDTVENGYHASIYNQPSIHVEPETPVIVHAPTIPRPTVSRIIGDRLTEDSKKKAVITFPHQVKDNYMMHQQDMFGVSEYSLKRLIIREYEEPSSGDFYTYESTRQTSEEVYGDLTAGHYVVVPQTFRMIRFWNPLVTRHITAPQVYHAPKGYKAAKGFKPKKNDLWRKLNFFNYLRSKQLVYREGKPVVGVDSVQLVKKIQDCCQASKCLTCGDTAQNKLIGMYNEVKHLFESTEEGDQFIVAKPLVKLSTKDIRAQVDKEAKEAEQAKLREIKDLSSMPKFAYIDPSLHHGVAWGGKPVKFTMPKRY
eukprot:gene10207-11889_t